MGKIIFDKRTVDLKENKTLSNEGHCILNKQTNNKKTTKHRANRMVTATEMLPNRISKLITAWLPP